MDPQIFAEARLYLLLTRGMCARNPLEVLEAAIAGGVDLVQVREKPFGDDALTWIEAVIDVCCACEVPVIVNDRLELALATGADGVHLGQKDLAGFRLGKLHQRSYCLGVSVHDFADLDRAMFERPDYLGIGNCFPTATKGFDTANDPEVLRELFARAQVPAFAIGGITTERLREVLAMGARRIAVSRAILGASDPAATARELADGLREGA